MSAHTEGPWTLGKRTKQRIAIDAKSGGWWRLCKVVVRMNGTDEDSAEGLANANLIAAAPELLAALKALLQANDDVQTALCDGPGVPGWDRSALPRAQANVTAAEALAKSIILKAEGRS